MSNQSSNVVRASVLIVSGIFVLTVGGIVCWLKYQKKKAEKIPISWRRVGEISELICYPIKSCGPIRIKKISCSKLGLDEGELRDRVFMVTDLQGKFVTGREQPKLVLVQPSVKSSRMTLTAPGMINIELDIRRLYTIPSVKSFVWGQEVDAVDCGEEVAKWLSRFLLSEDFGLRLVFYFKKDPTRDVKGSNKSFENFTLEDTGALHDSSSFMLFNESSLADLNERLTVPVSYFNFRPNFVVKGPLPYEEDHWNWIKIGNNTIFRSVKPCTRCLFTTINPESGERSADREPLRTLQKYRLFPKTGSSPVLGVHLGLRIGGTVALGDQVFVGMP